MTIFYIVYQLDVWTKFEQKNVVSRNNSYGKTSGRIEQPEQHTTKVNMSRQLKYCCFFKLAQPFIHTLRIELIRAKDMT